MPTKRKPSLKQTAAKINTEYKSILANQRDTMERVRMIGQLLINAKERVEHGGWHNWVDANCPFTRIQASKYQKIANHWDILVDAESMTIDQACRFISDTIKSANDNSDDHLPEEGDSDLEAVQDLMDDMEDNPTDELENEPIEEEDKDEYEDTVDDVVDNDEEPEAEEDATQAWRNDKVRQDAIILETELCNMMKGSVFTGNKSHEQCQLSMQRVIDFIQRILDKGKA